MLDKGGLDESGAGREGNVFFEVRYRYAKRAGLVGAGKRAKLIRAAEVYL